MRKLVLLLVTVVMLVSLVGCGGGGNNAHLAVGQWQDNVTGDILQFTIFENNEWSFSHSPTRFVWEEIDEYRVVMYDDIGEWWFDFMINDGTPAWDEHNADAFLLDNDNAVWLERVR